LRKIYFSEFILDEHEAITEFFKRFSDSSYRTGKCAVMFVCFCKSQKFPAELRCSSYLLIIFHRGKILRNRSDERNVRINGKISEFDFKYISVYLSK